MKFDRKTIFIGPNGLIIIAALLIILISPSSRLSEDQQLLQKELEENAELLKKQHDALFNDPNPSTPPQEILPEQPVESQIPVQSVEPTTGIETQPPSETILPSPSEPTVVETAPEVTAIGDSVMLGTVSSLQSLFPSIYIDAATSRQVWDADEIITSLKEKNLLGEKVIIALGANGTFQKEVGQKILDLIDLSTHTVYWVLPYGDAIPYQADVVDKVYQLQYDNPSLVVIDWPLIGYDHPEWFYDDNTHLNADGQQGYAQYLYDCIYGG